MRSLFYIARHGSTRLNESNKYRGWSNGPDAQLDAEGKRGAHEQGVFLSKLGQKFSKIICSPFDRTLESAAIIAGYVGIENLHIDPRLKPLNVGNLAGQPKDEHPIQPYLKNKSRKFPGGESVNEFEARQHSFAQDLLAMVEAEKSQEDLEILVVAHVSNVMFWWNLQTSANSEEYLSESTDILKPSGIALVTEHSTIPIFKANDESDAEGNSKLPNYPSDHKVGMEVPEGGSNCDKCDYLKGPQKCGEKHFIQWNGGDKIPIKTSRYCCDFFEEKK